MNLDAALRGKREDVLRCWMPLHHIHLPVLPDEALVWVVQRLCQTSLRQSPNFNLCKVRTRIVMLRGCVNKNKSIACWRPTIVVKVPSTFANALCRLTTSSNEVEKDRQHWDDRKVRQRMSNNGESEHVQELTVPSKEQVAKRWSSKELKSKSDTKSEMTQTNCSMQFFNRHHTNPPPSPREVCCSPLWACKNALLLLCRPFVSNGKTIKDPPPGKHKIARVTRLIPLKFRFFSFAKRTVVTKFFWLFSRGIKWVSDKKDLYMELPPVSMLKAMWVALALTWFPCDCSELPTLMSLIHS